MPIALNGEAIHAVVIGGGTVATRKALALLDAGAWVTVIAPAISDAIIAAANGSLRLQLNERLYAGIDDLAGAEIVFAATDSNETNSRIAVDAKSLHRLVDVVSDGSLGSFVSMATHRDGQVTIGVSAGGAPKEAIRIRDSIAEQLSGEGAR